MSNTTKQEEQNIIKAVQHGKTIVRWHVSPSVRKLTPYAIERAENAMRDLTKLKMAETGYFDLQLVASNGRELDADILVN